MRNTALAIALALAMAPAAFAAKPNDTGPIAFKKMDANGDGIVSEAEFNKAHANRMSSRAEEGRMMKNAGKMAQFKQFDTNGDGKITAAEYTKTIHARQSQMRQEKLKDKGKEKYQDKRLKQKRHERMNRSHAFNMMDSNHDGKLSAAEFEKAPNDKMKAKMADGKAMNNNQSRQLRFKGMDKNGDGYLSPEEFGVPKAKKPSKQ